MPDHLHLDTSGGATAEALLAALVDLGVPLHALDEALATVPETAGLRVSSTPQGAKTVASAPPCNTAVPVTEAIALVQVSDLAPAIRERAGKALRLLGEAIGCDEPLALTELGATIAVSTAVETLGPATISASPLPLPRETQGELHDALLTLLSGSLVRVTELPPGSVTPPGLALVRSLADPAVAIPEFELAAHGTGGTLGSFPLVQVLAGRRRGSGDGAEKLVLLETNLDDLQPELLATLIPSCLAAGAVDAWLTSVLMKKGRPAQVLSALCPPGAYPAVEQMLFRESSTLGVRRTEVARTSLPRRTVQVETPWGAVAVKTGLSGSDTVNGAPEFEDCLLLAKAAGVPVKRVYAAALGAVESALQETGG